jgi:hypothetical protein
MPEDVGSRRIIVGDALWLFVRMEEERGQNWHRLLHEGGRLGPGRGHGVQVRSRRPVVLPTVVQKHATPPRVRPLLPSPTAIRDEEVCRLPRGGQRLVVLHR